MSFTKKTKQLVYAKYGGCCAYCGKHITERQMHVDHIHPKASYIQVDGEFNILNPNRIENLNPSCFACNNYKSFYSMDEFRMYLKQMFDQKPHYLFKSKTKMECAFNFGVLRKLEWDGKFYFERLLV